MKSDEVIALLKICLAQLKENGAHIKILTCDQYSTNQKIYRELELLGKDSFFIYESTIYYAIFNFLYLIKHLLVQLRNHENIRSMLGINYCNCWISCLSFSFIVSFFVI